MEASRLFDLVAARFPGAVSGFVPADARDVKDGARDAFFFVAATALVDVARLLRDDPDTRMDFLQNLTAVDWPQRQVIESVYHFFSYPHRHEIVVKVEAPRANPRLPSLAGIFPTANWHEREQFDLLGVVYEGHPDLRRLLLPDDWLGHPMRKDYVEARAYRGMPTTRPSPMDLIARYDAAHAPKPTPIAAPKSSAAHAQPAAPTTDTEPPTASPSPPSVPDKGRDPA